MCIIIIILFFIPYATFSKLYVVFCVIIASDSSWVCLSVVVRHAVQMINITLCKMKFYNYNKDNRSLIL